MRPQRVAVGGIEFGRITAGKDHAPVVYFARMGAYGRGWYGSIRLPGGFRLGHRL